MTGTAPTARVALVTGAGHGIGAATAVRLAADRHLVAVCDVHHGRSRRREPSTPPVGTPLPWWQTCLMLPLSPAW
jgi:NAD(P)-dependent dehydrogenase (short-subunit alcohol dehydrogenase family)